MFDSIDTDQKTARLIGNAGAADVTAVVTGVGLTLLEQSPAGSINITTVYAAHDSPGSDRFVLVHSRHHDSFGPFPSQFHGTGRVLQ